VFHALRQRAGWSGKTLAVVLLCVFVAVGLGSGLWLFRSGRPWDAYGKCRAYGPLYDSVGPGSFRDFSKKAHAIVVAQVLNPDVFRTTQNLQGPPGQIRITQVIKGADVLHVGEVLPLCPGIGTVKLPSTPNPAVLVFLDGRDGNVWVPSQGTFGIIPQEGNGTFTADWVQTGPRQLTANGVLQVVKEVP